MLTVIKKITLILSAILLSIVLLFPVVVKFVHIIDEHNHFVCTDLTTTHFHKKDFNCEYFKQLTSHQIIQHSCNEFVNISLPSSKTIISFYFLISDFQDLHFNLRGPPTLFFFI